MGKCKETQGKRKKCRKKYAGMPVVKRLMSILLALVMVWTPALEAFAYEEVPVSVEEPVSDVQRSDGDTFTYEGINYQVISESAKTARVVGPNTSVSGEVCIGVDSETYEDKTVNGYTVTEIGDEAFKGNKKITYIMFPSTIIKFGTGVLDGCSTQLCVASLSDASLSLPSVEGYRWILELGDADEYVTSVTGSGQGAAMLKEVGTVTFYFKMNDGTDITYYQETITCGDAIPRPSDPTRSGYTFKNWYQTAEESSSTYNFSLDTSDWKSKNITTQTIYAHWTVEGTTKSLTDSSVQITIPASTYTYTGNKIEPVVTVLDGTNRLIQDKDYTLTYSNNVDVGTATITVRGSGNYSGVVNVYFTISKDSPKSLTDSSVSIELETNTYTYSGNANEPKVTVKDGTTTLTEGTDYTLSYSNNVNAGTGTVTVNGIEKYSGSVNKYFTINKADITKRPPATMNVDETVTKVGEVSLSAYPDWSWSDASVTLTPGSTTSATAVYKDTSNYNNPTQTVQITCKAMEISTCTVTGLLDSYTYTGSAIEPAVTVMDGNNTLVKDTDYTIGYSNQINVGTAVITITGKNRYTGTLTKNFTIAKKDWPANPPATTMEVEYDTTTTKVSQVSLSAYPNWQWQSAYENTALVEGEAVTAVAEYIGSDKENYKNTTVTVSITMKENPKKPVIGFTHDAPDSLSMIAGDTNTVRITSVLPENHVDYTVNWSSSDSSVVSVSGNGNSAVLTAAASGSAIISINVNNIIKQIAVTVTNPVKSATLSETNISIKGQATKALAIKSTVPANPDDYSIIWKSDDEKIATVSQEGVVTGIASGTAYITAVINGTVTTNSCKVTVTNPIESFVLSDTSIILTNTKNVQITSTVPANPDAYVIDWASANEGIAKVTKISETAAVISAVAEGVTTVTAMVSGTSIRQTIAVTVKPATDPLSGITVEPSVLTLTPNEEKGLRQYALSVSPVPEGAATGTITYASSDTSIASVDSNGMVTAKKSGTATITATAGGFSAQCMVTVTNPITSMNLNKTSMNLYLGNTGNITYSVSPADSDAYYVEFSSSDPFVAEVDGSGIVTAMGAGSATITVTAKDTANNVEVSRTCLVTVEEIELEDITVSPTSMDLVCGGATGKINVTAIPTNAELGIVNFESGNESVATVSTSGIVTAAGDGTTTVKVSVGNYVKTVTVNVTDPYAVKGFKLSQSTLSLKTGKTAALSITDVTPATATSYSVTWSSDNTNVATVDSNGTVKALTKGIANIKAVINGIEKTCSVTVEDTSELTDIMVSPETLKLTLGGESGRITVGAVPETAEIETVSFQSNDTAVVSVSKDGTDGIVTPVGKGTTTITVTADHYTKVVTVTVEEAEKVTGFTLNASSLNLKKGETTTLRITSVTPTTATYDKVTWSSSNPNVATVDTAGKVTALTVGTATIKAVINGIEKTCTVAVTSSETTTNPGNTEEQKPEVIAVKSIKITGATKKVAPGKKITLKAVVSPENATNQQVTWKVSNTKYASVSSKGVVTTKKAGKGKSVTVTAVSASDNSIKATYKISIMKSAVTKIKLSGKTTLKKGKSTTIKAKFTPSKNISKELTWSSSNKKIATVSSKGKVTAKKKGKVKITAKAKDGSGKKATITIQVK